MHYNKAQTMITKSILVLLIGLFYAGVLLFYGFAFGNSVDVSTASETLPAHSFSFSNIITGLLNVPFWINAIIFTPLLVTVIFLIVSSLPTFNGGS